MRRTVCTATLIVVLAVGLVAGLIQPALSQAAFDLTVSPAKLELQVAAGTGQDFAILVRNTGGEPQAMKIYFNDYSIKPDNDFVFEPPGHYSYSCAKWLQSENTSIQVPVGKTVETGFRVNVPAKAEPGGHYGVIFFEQQPPPGNANVRALPRIGALIMVTVPGQIVRQGEIKNVSITSTWFWPAHRLPILPTRKVKARMVFYNSGNVHLTVKGSLLYKPSFGWGAGKIDFAEITILPKTTRYLDADIPDPPLIGSFKVVATAQYGPSLDVFDTTKTASGSFSMYPLSLLLLLVILAALIVVATMLVRWCKKKSAEPEEGDKSEEKEAAGEKKPGKKAARENGQKRGEKDEPEPVEEPEGESDGGSPDVKEGESVEPEKEEEQKSGESEDDSELKSGVPEDKAAGDGDKEKGAGEGA